jgi:signal transduction histidine kinase
MHSTVKFDYSKRTRILNAIVTALYFLILGLVLYELDRQHYTGEKEAIIREHFREIFSLPDALADYAGDVLFSKTPAMRKASADRLRQEMNRVVAGPTSIFSIELQDANRQLVDDLRVVDPEKPRRLQTWRNSLFLRRFERITDLGVKRERGQPTAGRLVARYTSPPNYPPIEQLTRRYWMIAAGLVVAWVLGYIFLYRYILRPMHNVTVHLQGAYQTRPRLIPNATAGLEAAYNEMALRALLQDVNETMSELLKSPGQALPEADVLSAALDIIAEGFDTETLTLTEWHIQGEELTPVRTHRPAQGTAAAGADAGSNTATPGKCAMQLMQSPEQVTAWAIGSDGGFEFAAIVGSALITVVGRLRDPARSAQLRMEGVRLACEALARGLLAFSAVEKSISEQRREANISLARCIGHDLTNILASVRLNTLTVRDILNLPPEKLGAQEWALLREGVEAIADTMRLMQDIVDLYSSFSSIRRPEYKRCSLNELVGDLMAKYERTTSLGVRFERDFTAEMPQPVVEKRLLMLALFNVLTNAMDAFRSMKQRPVEPPRVMVRTHYDEDAGVFRIEVEDNGPGIRDSSDRLLGRGEIDVIFHHGYSTKSELSEGFGLYWVRTIMESFHSGAVHAENVPGGGARFVLELRSMEEREARIGLPQ